jgi:dolichol-phosphate mannosyltransferase
MPITFRSVEGESEARVVSMLSVVVPVFNEEDGIAELHRRLSSALEGIGMPVEYVLVNDGSRDRSAELLDAAAAADPSVVVVHLSRNFGHQAAVAAGLAQARGQVVAVIDADLQDPPELIPTLLEQWRDGFQIVYGQRIKRRGDPVTKRALAWMYYRVVRDLANVDLPTDAGDFCLMDRRVVDLINAMPERNRYIRGLRAWVGFRQTAVPFERAERFAGERKYSFGQSLRLALNGIFSFSRAPLQLATWFGLLVSAVSFALGAWFLFRKLTVGFPVQGWASLVVIVLFLGGVQLITIGLLGEYLGRIYDEVKQRPLYIVGRVVQGTS